MEQKDAVNVLLTGRSEKGFAGLIRKIVQAKRLQFDLICLRPEVGPANQQFESTGKFKQAFLEELIRTYREAVEIRIYEDRIRHVTMFRDFFADLNSAALADQSPEARKPIHAEVIEVAENATHLDPVTEVAEVQRMINAHNEAVDNATTPSSAKSLGITRSVLYTGYLISPSDSDKMLAIANIPALRATDNNIRTFADNIMISPRPPSKFVIDKVGGLGKKMKWRVISLGSVHNKVWAARVEPANPAEKYFVVSPVPLVVLACRGQGRPVDANDIKSWQPLPEGKQFEFETVVGEKVQLKIEELQKRRSDADERGFKRVQPFDDDANDFPALGATQNSKASASIQPTRNFSQQRRNYSTNENYRPNASAYARAGGGRQQSGRGGPHSYGRGGSGGSGGRGGGGGGSAGPHGSSASGGRIPPRGGQQGFRGRSRGGHGSSYRSLDEQSRRNIHHNGPGGESGLTY